MSLRQMMDRLLEGAWVHPMWRGSGEAQGTLAVDVYETGDDVMVTATVPGVKPKDIEISIQGNILTIKGETRLDSDVKEEKYHRREWRFGKLMRQIALPDAVNSDQADARFENGVLTLRLPMAEEAKPRKIEIKSGAEAKRASRAA